MDKQPSEQNNVPFFTINSMFAIIKDDKTDNSGKMKEHDSFRNAQ